MAASASTVKVTFLGDAAKLASAAKDAGGKLEKFAKVAAAAGAAAGAALAAGVVGAMNVEKANDKLAAQLGLTASESERIGGVAGKLYANAYGDSLEGVNTAVGAVISSIKGMRTASSSEVEKMSAKVLDLAAAFEVDVSQAAQIAGQMITSGLARDGAHAMDLLAASMQSVPAAVRGDLMDAIDEYSPFMTSIGITGEKAFGLLVKAAEKGMYGIDKTGDALKEFTIRATDMSSASATGYDLLGMSQANMTRKLLEGGEVGAAAFEQIVTGLQGIKDPAKQSQAALALFGTPLEDLSVQEIPAFLASLTAAEAGLGDTAGAADELGQTLNDNASTNIEAFKRQLTTTFVGVIGDKVIPKLDALYKKLTELWQQHGPAVKAAIGRLRDAMVDLGERIRAGAELIIRNWDAIKTAVVAAGIVMSPVLILLGLQVAALGVAATVSAAKQVAAWIASAAASVASAAKMYVASILVIGQWVAMGGAAIKSGAMMAKGWLMALGPIGLGILAFAAIAAAIAVAWQKSETFRTIVRKAMGGALGAVEAFLGGIESMLRALGRIPGFGWADKAADKVRNAARAVAGLRDRMAEIKSKTVTVTVVQTQLNNIGRVPHGQRAHGGPVLPGRPYLVGERGPEMIVPKAAGTVLDAKRTAGMGGGPTYVLNVSGTLDASINERTIQETFRRMELLAGTGG